MGLWATLAEKADEAVNLYDDGEYDQAERRLAAVWKEFQQHFSSRQDRRVIGGSFDAYLESMSMVLDRLVSQLEENGDAQGRWELCQSVCELFDPDELWMEEYACYVGRVLEEKGRCEECDEWFEQYCQLKANQPLYAGHWANCLIHRQETARAKSMLDNLVAQNPNCDSSTMDFYLLAWKLYEALGETESAQLCQERIRNLNQWLLEDAVSYEEWWNQ